MAASNDMLIRLLLQGDASGWVQEVHKAEKQFGAAMQGMTRQAASIEVFGKLQRGAKDAASEFFRLKGEAEQYRKAIAQATGPTNDLQAGLDKTERALGKAEQRMRRQVEQVRELRKEMTAAGIDTRNLAAAQEQLLSKVAATKVQQSHQAAISSSFGTLGLTEPGARQAEADKLQLAYDRLMASGKLNAGQQLEAAAALQSRLAELRSATATPVGGNFLGPLKAGALATVAALGSLTAAVQATRSVLDVAGQFETLRVQLNGVEKSAAVGGLAFQQMKQLALDTPFGVQGLTQSYIQLRNFGLNPMGGSLQAIVDQSAKLGGSQETLTRIGLALGQAWSKAKLQGDDILQMIDAGVPVWDLLGKKLSKSTAELQEMSQAGKLGRDVIQQLIQAMADDAKGAASAQVNTWEGMVSQLDDIWQQFLAEVAGSGLMQAAKDQIDQLMTAIRTAMTDGTAAAIGRQLAEAVRALGDIVSGTVGFIRDHADALKLLAGSAAGLAVLKMAAGWVGTLGDSLKALKMYSGMQLSVGLLLDQAGIGQALTKVAQLAESVRAAGLGLSTLSASSAAAAAGLGVAGVAVLGLAKVTMDAMDRLQARQERMLSLSQKVGDLQRSGRTEVGILSDDQLNSMNADQRATYEEDLRRSLQAKQAMLQQRAEQVARNGGDAAQDADSRRLAREMLAYSKALAEFEGYAGRRSLAEDRFNKNVQAVRNGQLANLAESLAKEQKLYNLANERLQQATADRLKHQEAWGNNKAKDPAKAQQDPSGVTDFYESMSKAKQAALLANQLNKKAGETGLDADMLAAKRATATAEEQWRRVMDVINKLRSSGKITEGEFNLFNDQAAREQDTGDAAAEQAAKERLQAMTEKVEALKKAAEAVRNLPIGFDTEGGIFNLEKVMAQMQQAARERPIIVPMQYVGPDGKLLEQARQDAGLPGKGYAGGGYTGDGGRLDPAGVVHRGEFVQTKARMQEPGALPFMWDFHARGMEALKDWRGYADGGLVADYSPLAASMAMPSVTAGSGASGGGLSPVIVNFPGYEPIHLRGDGDAVAQLERASRRQNLKRGN